MNKNKIVLYLCIAIFGIIGVYLTFISGNMNKFDSQARAYRIDPNESYDADDGTTYYPIYYFKVEGKDYECKAKLGSSSYPNEKKNIVYYDSDNPLNCRTEYEKSSGKFAGIVCLIVTALIIYFGIIKKPSDNVDIGGEYTIDEETVEKVTEVVGKVQLIVKRVILGIIIVVLLVFILIDTAILKQTIVTKDYLDATAVYVNKKDNRDDNIFDEGIYTFTDNNGREQEIVVTISKEFEPKEKIKIKYNENNPQDYYGEDALMDKKELIWYIVKIVAMILLIVLFFNKKLLSKINVSAGR